MQDNKVSKIILTSLLFGALLVYSTVSIWNHYLFRTYSLDLGAYTKCLYDYMHGIINNSLVYRSEPVNCLASHFDLYLLIFSPLYLLFGTYTLLIIQIISTVIGGYGIYKLIGLYCKNKYVPLYAMAAFYSFFGVYHAITFDYHSNVVATMLIPWFFYTFKKKQFVNSTILAFCFIIAKENLSLLMAFICLGLTYDYRKEKESVIILLVYTVFALLYFYVITSIIMPSLNDNGNMRGFVRFKQWGNNFSEIIMYFITNPIDIISVLFDNKQKIEFWICLFLSGGFFMLLKPNYLFMTIPIIASKMLANYPALWGIFLHYNVELAPIVLTACFISIQKISSHYLLHISTVILLLSIGTLIYTIHFSSNWHNKNRSQIFNKRHYERPNLNIKDAYSYMQQIPDNESVCASDIFVPHLCLRENIYTYHDKKVYDTDWMLLFEPEIEITTLLGNYNIKEQSGNLWLLQKKK